MTTKLPYNKNNFIIIMKDDNTKISKKIKIFNKNEKKFEMEAKLKDSNLSLLIDGV